MRDMNTKYERYIEYIADDVEPPYFENMRDAYGVKAEEYRLVFAKLFNQPVIVEFYDKVVRNRKDMPLYYEDNDGYWKKYEYDEQNNLISNETSTGHWERYEYDKEGNMIYRENSSGTIVDYR
jgi:YD repeat-containing protein